MKQDGIIPFDELIKNAQKEKKKLNKSRKKGKVNTRGPIDLGPGRTTYG